MSNALVHVPAGRAEYAEWVRTREAGPRSWILGLDTFRDWEPGDSLPPMHYSRRGIAYALALTFSAGYYRSREAAMWQLSNAGLRAGPTWWWPTYAVVRDAVAGFVPYDDACRAALAVTIREIERA